MKEYPDGFWDTHDNYWLNTTKETLLAAGVTEDEICAENHEKDTQVSVIQATLTKEQAESFIPQGMYCYDEKICPFWDKIAKFPHQQNGYCHYLKQGDFTKPGHDLLWDQCKCCGVKDGPETTGNKDSHSS